MRIQQAAFLALASLLILALGDAVSFTHDDALDAASSGVPARLDMAAKYPAPGPQCNACVGMKMIFMAEVTEVCPDGSTVTETITESVSTLTHSICATSSTNRPCYPCVMSPTPSLGDAATVTVTSCAAAIDPTVTITIQRCDTCTSSTYTGTFPTCTPGESCGRCSPYTGSPYRGSTSSPGISGSCSESGNATLVPMTTTVTSTSTVTGCTSSPPGDPNAPSSTSSTGSPTLAATNTPYKPTTAAPPEVTAAGARCMTVGWIWAIGLAAMVCVVLGL
ncbi:uncharacterized protein B0T15DRAFT_208135 [Chaetomium strumarium]|uniref:Uncharacterized protein n=1 Tax=Chaetomium strumarium TaxID=1170767 RepID=A0AAJ0GTE0_9PEZI|nr:hypothetical protein B0T15DRAFT_208135 [Chaetomium strumarium]